MRLYHLLRLFISTLLLGLLAGCAAPQVTQGLVNVSLSVDGKTAHLTLPAGTTVQQALENAGVVLGPLDRVDPPTYTVLTEGGLTRVIRVTEEFSIEQITLPFDKQVVKNESLPDGESRLIQPGVNGLQEITYRKVFEDGEEVSTSPVKSVVLQEPAPEIVMVGSQVPFAPVNLPGKLVYLSAGNAWVLEGNSSNRRPIVITGDLDGRVFKLSPDRAWLLFTRRGADENTINTLWAAKIDDDSGLLIDLQVANVIHFADWVPNSVLRVAFSTVEPRATAPGWQANNDLSLVSFSTSGWVSRRTVVVETNSGGIYGWWGTSFVWAPDGQKLAYARPDGVGLLDFQSGALTPLLAVPPLQTQGDWAWVPGVSWAPTGDSLYTVNHAPPQGDTSPEASPLFDLAAVPLMGGAPIPVIPQAGMFAYPSPSPVQARPSGEQAYQVAYLQAIFPTQSDTSRYRLVGMDRDGSNRKTLFPPEGAPGLDPQKVLWAPAGEGSPWLALLYQGNLWVVDSVSGQAQQLTGDGQLDRLDWR